MQGFYSTNMAYGDEMIPVTHFYKATIIENIYVTPFITLGGPTYYRFHVYLQGCIHPFHPSIHPRHRKSQVSLIHRHQGITTYARQELSEFVSEVGFFDSSGSRWEEVE